MAFFKNVRRLLGATVLTLFFSLFLGSCNKEYNIPIPQTVQFEQNLSAYNIFQGEMKNLVPSSDFYEIELSSILYSNYAKKQRLIMVPSGTIVTENGNGIPVFPEGSILVKTFYYFIDETNETLGKQIIETRLLIKGQGEWNVATYIWNENQTEATLENNGLDTQVDWIDAASDSRSIDYHVPSQNECVKCHQSVSEVMPIGPSLRNLNREVVRNSVTLNQLQHLQSEGVLNSFDISGISSIPDYNDLSVSLSDRGRAYMDMNCASCHNPDGLSEAEKKGFDFRFETELGDTKILKKKDLIIEMMEEGRMPDVGTTVIDQEGLDLMREYINSL